MPERAGRGQKPGGGVLGVKARLERVAVDLNLVLGAGQRLTGGHPELPFDQIDAGDRLAHRMFDLQAGVHFHEPEPVGAQTVAIRRR